MRLFGFLPVMGRRVVVALGVAGMLMVSQAAQAQDAAPAEQAAQPEAPDQLKFDGSKPVMLLLSIKPGQEMVFEDGYNQVKAGLAASSKPEAQAQARSFNLMKVNATPGPGQPSLYVLYLNPPVANVSYDWVKILYYSGAFDTEGEARAKVDAIYEKFSASLESQNLWELIRK